jgi:hypothetical protein
MTILDDVNEGRRTFVPNECRLALTCRELEIETGTAHCSVDRLVREKLTAGKWMRVYKRDRLNRPVSAYAMKDQILDCEQCSMKNCPTYRGDGL